jgi:hypothetical protein
VDGNLVDIIDALADDAPFRGVGGQIDRSLIARDIHQRCEFRDDVASEGGVGLLEEGGGFFEGGGDAAGFGGCFGFGHGAGVGGDDGGGDCDGVAV